MEKQGDLGKGINRLGAFHFIGGVSYCVEDAIKNGKKTVSIKELLRCFESARKHSEEYPDY